MIKANELRIGNWVIRKSSGTCQQVKEVLTSCVLLQNEPPLDIHKHMTIPLKNIEPIELTPDILIKCGLVRMSISNDNYPTQDCYAISYLRNNEKECRQRIFVTKNPVNSEFEFCVENIKNDFRICLNYCTKLHQLQNLYFSLTGEELEVNL